MRRHLNTIYVTTENAWLRKDGANIVVEVEGAERGRVPMHLVEGVVCFGRPGASPALMAACSEAGIALSFLTPQGKFMARVEGPRTGNVLLRRTQYRVADDPTRAVPIVRGIVTAKAANQRTVLRRALRDHRDRLPPATCAGLETAENRLGHVARRAAQADDVDTLRGHEGEAALVYFSAFDAMIQGDRSTFSFKGRSRRPPLDRVNALLSFLYAMLGHDCRSALGARRGGVRPTSWPAPCRPARPCQSRARPDGGFAALLQARSRWQTPGGACRREARDRSRRPTLILTRAKAARTSIGAESPGRFAR